MEGEVVKDKANSNFPRKREAAEVTKPYPPPDSGVPGPANRPRRPQPPGGRGRTRSAGKGVEQETGSCSQRTRDGGGDRANATSQPVSNPAGRGARFFALGGEGPGRPRRPCSLPRARRAGGDPETCPAARAPGPAPRPDAGAQRSRARGRSLRAGAARGAGRAAPGSHSLGRAASRSRSAARAAAARAPSSRLRGADMGRAARAQRRGSRLPRSSRGARRLPTSPPPARVVPRGGRSAPAVPRPRPARPAPPAPAPPSVPAPGIRPTSRPAPLPPPVGTPSPRPWPLPRNPRAGLAPPTVQRRVRGAHRWACWARTARRESDSGGTRFGIRDRPLLVSLLNNLKAPKKVAGRACGLPWKPLELAGATENLEKDAWSASWWGQTRRGGWSSVLPVSPPAAEVGRGWRWLQGPWTGLIAHLPRSLRKDSVA